MNTYYLPIFIRQSLLALSLSLFAGFAHANAIYDAHADALLSIDAVTNLTNAGDLSAFLVGGNVFLENEGSSKYGNVQTSYYGVIDLQSSSAADPGLLSQSSDAHGNAYPLPDIMSIAESHHSSLGEFNLTNLSSTDSFQIDFSLVYNLAVNAALSSILNENAYSNAFVRLIDTLLLVNLDQTLSADAKGILAPVQNAFGDTLQFSITLLPGEFDRLTLNVLARGNSESKAESVPEPATLYLLAGGLIGLANWRHRRRPSVV